jgi:hypothetical protein
MVSGDCELLIAEFIHVIVEFVLSSGIEFTKIANTFFARS